MKEYNLPASKLNKALTGNFLNFINYIGKISSGLKTMTLKNCIFMAIHQVKTGPFHWRLRKVNLIFF